MAVREELRIPGLCEPISHYTDAVRFGDLLFVSGVGPVAEDGTLSGGSDVVAQAEKVFENIKSILDAANASFADILKVTVYLTDVNDREPVNRVRQKYFGDARPASTLIGIKELALPGMKIEVESVVGLPAVDGHA